MRLLLLDLCTEETESIYKYFLTREEKGKSEIHKISITSRTIGDYLILPPTRGYDCTNMGYMRGYAIPPHDFPGQDQWMQLWLKDTLPYYLKKNVQVAGFGTSAIAVLELILGGSFDYDEQLKQLVPIQRNSLALFDEDGDFQTHMHYGFPGSNLLNGLAKFESHLAGHRNNPGNGGSTVVNVPVFVGPAPQSLKAVESKP